MKKLVCIFEKYLLCIICSLALCSCNFLDKYFDSKNKDDIIVSIGDNHLYDKDIKSLVPEGTNSADSTMIVNGYIKRWATNVLILENAKRNITDVTEIDNLVDNYRKTLIVHYYQQNMVNENVAMPTDIEAVTFYNDNKNMFILESPAVKGAMITIPNNVDISDLRKNFKNIESETDAVENFAVSYATKYVLFNDQWQSLKSIKDNISMPISISGVDYYETNDSTNTVLVNITSFIPAGQVAPQEMIIEKARQELYNKRKMEYLRNFGKNLYDYALRHDQINFHNKENQ